MVIRVFRGRASPRRDQEFLAFLRDELARLRSVDGLIDVHAGRRVEGDQLAFTIVTVWRDLDALLAWTGPDPDHPRVLIGHEHLVSSMEVEHYEVFGEDATAR